MLFAKIIKFKAVLTLRPHHLIDIIRNIGQKRPVSAHPYGHDQHNITRRIMENRDEQVRFKSAADDVCAPCMHLDLNGQCNDVLPQFEHRVMKQKYNDELDTTLLDFLRINENTVMTVSEFVDLIETNLEDLVPLCTHPGESFESRRDGLVNGIKQLRKI